jgi:glycerol-3-phosphate dehydrogenase
MSAASPDASRTAALNALRAAEAQPFDVVVVGGGATGLGVALDAALRGWRTVLLEAADFASGTSSRSTKLVHGGVRYLAQGRIGLVREALRERGRLLRNAAPATRTLPLAIPTHGLLDTLRFGVGMKLYDALSGGLAIGRSRRLDAAATRAALPGVRAEHLGGAVLYHDGQFDDARVAVALARSAAAAGAIVASRMRVDRLLRDPAARGAGGTGESETGEGRVDGVEVVDTETGERFALRARCVVNATGVWVDALRTSASAEAVPVVAPSQGAHVVIDRRFFPGDTGLLVPETDDGRVLFVLPWHGAVLIGTTDVALDALPAAPGSGTEADPAAQDREVDFILATAARYLAHAPTRADVRSAWAGVRPLVRPAGGDAASTASLSREHWIEVSAGGLVTVTGGKWTTYRAMAEDVLDAAVRRGLLEARACHTADAVLHDFATGPGAVADLAGFDASRAPDAATVRALVDHTFALTVDDVLSRRSRLLLLDARAAAEAAPAVAAAVAAARGKDAAWAQAQCEAFGRIARRHDVRPAARVVQPADAAFAIREAPDSPMETSP